MHLYMAPYAAIWPWGRGRCSAGDHAITDAKRPDCIPGHFPQLLPRAPNSAGLLYGDAQVGFVPGDTHADEIMVVSPRLSYASVSWRLVDYQFRRL